jgi:hypothetical protein
VSEIDQGRDVEKLAYLTVIVVTNVGRRSERLNQVVALFPDADSVGFDARHLLKIVYLISVHCLTKV